MLSTISLRSAAFAAAALFVMGCKGNVSVDPSECQDPKPEVPPGAWCPPAYECIDGEWMDTAGACPEPLCPEAKPASGAACELIGQTCSYQEDIPCGPIGEVQAVCTADGWEVMANYCQPEPVCPDEMPIPGADCADWPDAYACNYAVESSCGTMMAFLHCDISAEGMTWKLDGGPTCGACEGYGAEADCNTDAACQWLTPGCGEAPIEMGCYPKQGCDVTDCPDDSLVCVERIYDPCYGELCDACGASYFTCVPL